MRQYLKNMLYVYIWFQMVMINATLMDHWLVAHVRP